MFHGTFVYQTRYRTGPVQAGKGQKEGLDGGKRRIDAAIGKQVSEGVVAWSYLSPPDVNPGADGILTALESLTSRQGVVR